MAIPVLIYGESGSGKSYSTKNLDESDVLILSVEKPILPYRKKMEIRRTPDCDSIIKEMKNTSKKVIVVDDFQYILGMQSMRRSLEKGWDKFSEMQYDYFKVLDAVKGLPDDVIVVFLSHSEKTEDGDVKIKTIGKALDKYITIEGMFMIVLSTLVSDGKYYFTTQTNGKNTVKSPEDMFPSYAIDNDLSYVVDKIRNYYYMDGAKTDEEMKSADAEVQTDVEKPSPGGRRQSRREKAAEKEMEKVNKALDKCEGDEVPYEEFANAIQQVEQEEPEMMGVDTPRRSRTTEPVEEVQEQSVEEEPVKPRTRRRRA